MTFLAPLRGIFLATFPATLEPLPAALLPVLPALAAFPVAFLADFMALGAALAVDLADFPAKALAAPTLLALFLAPAALLLPVGRRASGARSPG